MPHGRCVNDFCSGHQSGDGIRDCQTAIAMAVPLHANVLAGRLHNFVDDKVHQRDHAHRRRVTGGIADHDGLRAVANRGAVEPLNGFGIAAGGVLGHVHDVEAEPDRILHGVFRGALQEVVGPVFGVAADGAGADEGRHLDGNAGGLHDLGDRTNVVLMRAGCAVGLDLQLGAADLARQRLAMRLRARARAGQADVEHVDADGFHQVKDLDLLLDGRIADRRRLQPVAQRFVIQQDAPSRDHRLGVDCVPVVNQLRNIRGHLLFHPTLSDVPQRRSIFW